jgi:hypothetical protein
MLVLEDHSTNGSYINGQQIHHTRTEIKNGDRIYLGKDYQLRWEEISRCFPETGSPNEISRENRQTQRYVYQDEENRVKPDYHREQDERQQKKPVNQQAINDVLRRWNWGAFFFGWIWGIAHRIYWPLVTLIPFIGWFAALVICFVLGVNGNRWAWESRQWESLEEFRRVQRNWAKWGVGILIGSFSLMILSFLIIAIAAASY